MVLGFVASGICLYKHLPPLALLKIFVYNLSHYALGKIFPECEDALWKYFQNQEPIKINYYKNCFCKYPILAISETNYIMLTKIILNSVLDHLMGPNFSADCLMVMVPPPPPTPSRSRRPPLPPPPEQDRKREPPRAGKNPTINRSLYIFHSSHTLGQIPIWRRDCVCVRYLHTRKNGPIRGFSWFLLALTFSTNFS